LLIRTGASGIREVSQSNRVNSVADIFRGHSGTLAQLTVLSLGDAATGLVGARRIALWGAFSWGVPGDGEASRSRSVVEGEVGSLAEAAVDCLRSGVFAPDFFAAAVCAPATVRALDVWKAPDSTSRSGAADAVVASTANTPPTPVGACRPAQAEYAPDSASRQGSFRTLAQATVARADHA
jgi:hypothetical protein